MIVIARITLMWSQIDHQVDYLLMHIGGFNRPEYDRG